MPIMKPQINIHHRQKVNRMGKHYQVRIAHYAGYVKVDRKTQEWAYCEVRKVHTAEGAKDMAVPLIKSKGWAEYMEAMNPDHIMHLTPNWVSKISLRERARH